MSFITYPQFAGGIPQGLLAPGNKSWLLMELVAPFDWYHVTTLQEVDGIEVESIFLISRLTTLLAFSTHARIRSVGLVGRDEDDEWRMFQLAQIWKATDSTTGNSVTLHQLVGGEKRISGSALQFEELTDLEMLLDLGR